MAYPLESVQKKNLLESMGIGPDDEIVRRFAEGLITGPSGGGPRIYGPELPPGFVPPPSLKQRLARVAPSPTPSPTASDGIPAQEEYTDPTYTPGMAMAEEIPVKPAAARFQDIAEKAQALLGAPMDTTPQDSFPMGSGKGVSEQERRNLQQNTSIQQNLPMEAAVFRELLKRYKQTEGYKNQAAGIDRMESMRPEADPRFDISPLIALTDSETGSNLMKGYNRPLSQAEQFKAARDWADKIQDDRNQLEQRAISAITAQKTGSTQMDLIKLLIDRAAGTTTKAPNLPSASGANKATDNLFKFKDRFDKDTKGAREGMESLDGILNSLAANNWVGDIALPAQLARSMGAQPLSNFDLQRIKDPKLSEVFRGAMNRLFHGRQTKLAGKQMEQFAEVVRRHFSRRYNDTLSNYVGTKAKAFKIPEQDARDALTNPWVNSIADEYKANKASAMPPEIQKIRAKPATSWSDAETAQVKAYFDAKDKAKK